MPFYNGLGLLFFINLVAWRFFLEKRRRKKNNNLHRLYVKLSLEFAQMRKLSSGAGRIHGRARFLLDEPRGNGRRFWSNLSINVACTYMCMKECVCYIRIVPLACRFVRGLTRDFVRWAPAFTSTRLLRGAIFARFTDVLAHHRCAVRFDCSRIWKA